MATSFLELSEISVGYGNTRVLDNINLKVGKGEFVALLGASGCGKTTLLRTIAGFVTPTGGKVSVEGCDVTRQPPDRRGMALVFQSYALWPHMTVAQNIGYGLRLRKRPKSEIETRVAGIEALLGLQNLGSRKPGQLSGGQKQRVALGRALAINPEILLLDEPLSNLDARIRLTVRHEIRALQQRLGITAIHVTHDREEAMVMADRIAILDGGRIAQLGTPETIYNHPSSPFVAAFMGAENVLKLHGSVLGGDIELSVGATNPACRIPIAGRPLSTGAIEARFRPEAASIHAAPVPVSVGVLLLSGQIVQISYPGGMWRHLIRVGDAEVMVDAPQAFTAGQSVTVTIPQAALFLFNDTAARRGASPLPSLPSCSPALGNM